MTQAPRPPFAVRVCGRRGSTVVEALIGLTILGLGAAAVTGLMLPATGAARNAALEGRRAEVAQRAMDRVRTGLAAPDSGIIRFDVGREAYEAEYVHRDGVAPGALELRVTPPGDGASLVLEAARPVP